MMYRSIDGKTFVFGTEMMKQYEDNNHFGPGTDVKLVRIERYKVISNAPLQSIIFYRVIFHKSEIP